MACSINLTELFDLAGQGGNELGSWFTGASVDCCVDCGANPQVATCPDPPGGASINNPSALTITGNPPDTVDFEDVTPGCYWFRYETPDWIANNPTPCEGCGDCEMYKVTVVAMANVTAPDDKTACDKGRNNCTNNEKFNIWDYFDCGRLNLIEPVCATCDNITGLTGAECDNLTGCLVRTVLDDPSSTWVSPKHTGIFDCDTTYTTCGCDVLPCDAQYEVSIEFSNAPSGAYNASDGTFDPCEYAHTYGAPSSVVVTLTIKSTSDYADGCDECNVTASFTINITEGENAGTHSEGQEVCS